MAKKNTEITIQIPQRSEKCSICNSYRIWDETYPDFSEELLTLFEKVQYVKREQECSQCGGKIRDETISIHRDEVCNACGNGGVIDDFCSPDCFKEFVKSKLDAKAQKRRDQEGLRQNLANRDKPYTKT